MEIDQKNVAQVLERFYNCEDALLHSVNFSLTSSPSIATATIETQDREALGGWSTLVLTVSDVTNAQLVVGRIILQILSNGIQIVWKDELVYLVLDAYPDDGPGLPIWQRTMPSSQGAGVPSPSPPSRDGRRPADETFARRSPCGKL